MASTRETYHHGELRSALIEAADKIITEGGIESFTLREAARRAGVSPGAPAHHFGGIKGLLTEVALIAYERLGFYLQEVSTSSDPAANIRAIALAYSRFALDHPGHFRLMFRHDLVDRSDPRYRTTSQAALGSLGAAAAAYRGTSDPLGKIKGPLTKSSVAVFELWATIHGIAQLVLEEKASAAFDHAPSREFVAHTLPKVLKSIWP